MKKVLMHGFSGALMAAIIPVAAHAQVEVSVGADVVSGYVWRGQKLGDAAVQPGISLGWKGLTLGAWGSVPVVTSADAKEFDLSIGYQIGKFSIGLTDYWFDTEGVTRRYFHYGAHETAHVWEATVGYDFGPLRADWYTNIGGADGVNSDGDRAYSSYVQLTAPFQLGGLDWEATVGAVPYATSFYAQADGFAVTNVSVKVQKSIQITSSFSLPLFGQLIWNPSTEGAWMVAGLRF